MERGAFSAINRRRAAYSYLRPIVEGRRVLEVGSVAVEGAAHLMALGAARVATAGHAASAQGGPFDVVLVPDAAEMFRPAGVASLAAARALVAPGGRLVCVAGNGDAGPGVAYYDVVDALTPHFVRVRMFGQTPFLAFGLAEFDEAVGALRVDSRLVEEAQEQPTHYLVVAGPDEPLALGYALVQVPLGVQPFGLQTSNNGGMRAPADVADLRRSLAEVQGQAEGALRVSRAQGEEIEELRARLRRAAESRAQLDEEVARLRRALAEADESVLNLTRRTTEEMASLAQKLTAGLRPAVAGARDDLQAALAARESALSERDERIAALEGERQDLEWRLQTAEEHAKEQGRAALAAVHRAAPASAASGDVRSAVTRADSEDLVARLRAREQALDEYRCAAQVHVDEVTRLRDTLTDQATLVAELEDGLGQAEGRLKTAEQEAARLRKLAAETEEADRQRRSRLAELEGTLLRLQRQAALADQRSGDTAQVQRLSDRIAALENEMRGLEAGKHALETDKRRLEAENHGLETEKRLLEGDKRGLEARTAEAVQRVSKLESVVAEREGLARELVGLQARLAEVETGQDKPRLEALAEVAQLRQTIERAEEQLWEARAQIFADHERIDGLERAAADARSASAVFAAATRPAHGHASDVGSATVTVGVADEIAALEAALRSEAAQLAAAERSIAQWREALGRGDAAPGSPPNVTES